MNYLSQAHGAAGDGQGSAAPPDAPSIERRWSLTRKQWIGLPLIAAVPVLTLLGLFGERRTVARATSSALEATVVYPERFRYRQVQALDVTVRNRSSRLLDTLYVSLDTAYITRFSSVRIEPPPQGAFVVSLTNVRPNESRLVSAELWGEQYGRHRGRIVAWTRGDSLTVPVQTIVFP